ncbi:MAG: hypothetical protein N3C60_06695 [Calditerrivibrio sp.]|nr:hypothetical protein [Calditerrivibrio sp.]
MKMICKKCNADIETDKKIFSCNVCGESYDLNLKTEEYEIKLLNGLKVSSLTYEEIKEGIARGKYLSVDYITFQGAPWMRLKDSDFSTFLPSLLTDSKKTVAKTKNWFYLFILSLAANIVMLVLIYIITKK